MAKREGEHCEGDTTKKVRQEEEEGPVHVFSVIKIGDDLASMDAPFFVKNDGSEVAQMLAAQEHWCLGYWCDTKDDKVYTKAYDFLCPDDDEDPWRPVCVPVVVDSYIKLVID